MDDAGIGSAKVRQSLRIFYENGARAGSLKRLSQFGRRIVGVERRSNRTVGENSQIGKVEFQPRLGIQRDDITLFNTKAAQAGCDLLRCLPILIPGVD